MNKAVIALLAQALLAGALVGCSLVQSKEAQCLQSTRLDFKDPDSLAAVTNLGQRGETVSDSEGSFWLRYKAKNSYGAFTSANMACKRSGSTWVRDRGREDLAHKQAYTTELRAITRQLKAHNEKSRACKTAQCSLEQTAAILDLPGRGNTGVAMEEAEGRATELVFESLAGL